MDRIRALHLRFVYGSIVLCATLYFAALQFANADNPILTDISEGAAALNLSWSVFPVLLIGLYEWFGWRLLSPTLDVAGVWDFDEKQYRTGPDGKLVFDYDAWGSLKFAQNTRRIAIIEGHTHKGLRTDPELAPAHTHWSSLTCDLDAETGAIVAALGHAGTVERAQGHEYFGVEEFQVTDRGFLGRPIRMTSTVRHTIGTPAARVVNVNYTRRGVGPRPRGAS